jgi:ABC-2 type transport system permease protein
MEHVHVRRPGPTDLGLLRRWIVARVQLTLRSSRAAFFTFVFPLLLLTLLDATSGDSKLTVPGGEVDFAQYFTPSIAIYALSVGCYATPIFMLAAARELGLLKRVRGTPLSPWIYVGAWLAGSILTGLAAVLLLFVVAVPVFGVNIYPSLLPAAIVTALLGAGCLAALGFAVATYARRAESAPAIANLTLFPLSFLSGVFFPLQNAPGWVVTIAHIFPLSHLVEAFTGCFSPYTQGSGFEAGDLAVIAAWGLGGLLVAVWRFRWDTDTGERPRSRFRLPLPGAIGARRS